MSVKLKDIEKTINETWIMHSDDFRGIPENARNELIADLAFFTLFPIQENGESDLSSRIDHSTDYRETDEFKRILEIVKNKLPTSVLSEDNDNELKKLHKRYTDSEVIKSKEKLKLTMLSINKLNRLLKKLNSERYLTIDESKDYKILVSLLELRLKSLEELTQSKERDKILIHKRKWSKHKIDPTEKDQLPEKIVKKKPNNDYSGKSILKVIQETSSTETDEEPIELLGKAASKADAKKHVRFAEFTETAPRKNHLGDRLRLFFSER